MSKPKPNTLQTKERRKANCFAPLEARKQTTEEKKSKQMKSEKKEMASRQKIQKNGRMTG